MHSFYRALTLSLSALLTQACGPIDEINPEEFHAHETHNVTYSASHIEKQVDHEPKRVRFIYVSTRNRRPKKKYKKALERAAKELQAWYRDEVGRGKTFALNDPIVETVISPQSDAWFQNTPRPETTSEWVWWYNALYETQRLLGIEQSTRPDPNVTYVIFVDSDQRCGQQGGGGRQGFTVMPANDLRGLSGRAGRRICNDHPQWWYELPPCRYVGGVGHELGHAFGLQHLCSANSAECNDREAIMDGGYQSFPETYLRAQDKRSLRRNAFFSRRKPVDADVQCRR